jgi:hypothetical protein
MAPVICLIVPIICCVYIVLMDIPSTDPAVKFGLLLLVLQGLLNAMLTILFISPFRRHTYNSIISVFNSILRMIGLSRIQMGEPTSTTPAVSTQRREHRQTKVVIFELYFFTFNVYFKYVHAQRPT